jgi:hypothetical protein
LHCVVVAMKRPLHDLSDRERIELQETLNIPVGEFAALLIGAFLTLSFFFMPSQLATEAKNIAIATAGSVSEGLTHLGRVEARAAERNAAPGRLQ